MGETTHFGQETASVVSLTVILPDQSTLAHDRSVMLTAIRIAAG
jgi:hypothetical protein